jgi:hypothetical protein
MSDKEKIKAAISMIEEMLELAKQKDEIHKAQAIARGKGEQAIGESWEIYHLKALKDLLTNGAI